MCECALMKAGMMTPPLASKNSASGYFARSAAVSPVSTIFVPETATPPFSM